MASQRVVVHRYSLSDRISGTPLSAYALELPGRTPWLASSGRIAPMKDAYLQMWAKWHHQADEVAEGARLKTRINPAEDAVSTAQELFSFRINSKGHLFLQYARPEDEPAPTEHQLMALLKSAFPRGNPQLLRHRDTFIAGLGVPLQVHHDAEPLGLHKDAGIEHRVRMDIPLPTKEDEKFANISHLAPFRALFAQAVAAGHFTFSPDDELAKFMQENEGHLNEEAVKFLMSQALEQAVQKTRVLRLDLNRISLAHPLPPAHPQETYRRIVAHLDKAFGINGLVVHGI